MSSEIYTAEYSILNAIRSDMFDLVSGIDPSLLSEENGKILSIAQDIYRGKQNGTVYDVVSCLPGGVKAFNAALTKAEKLARKEGHCSDSDVPFMPMSRVIGVLFANAVSKKRDLLIKQLIYAHKNKNDEVISSVAREIADLESPGCVDKGTSILASGIGDALAGFLRFSLGDHSDRVPFGIKKIDNACMGGMMAGAIYLLGAMSGGGKTTFLQCIAVEAAKRGNVLFVSPEMTKDQLAGREIMRRSGYSIYDRGPWVRPDERVRVEKAHKWAAEQIITEGLPIYILEDIEAPMSEIARRAIELKNVRLIILDYAQEIADMDAKIARYLAIGEVGKDAISLGRRLNCPVLIASQLNAINGKNGAVDYSFREGMKIHHKANTSMILEVKREKIPDKNGFYEIESTRIFSMKNRGGPMFSVEVDYNPALYRIQDPEQKHQIWTPREKVDGQKHEY